VDSTMCRIRGECDEQHVSALSPYFSRVKHRNKQVRLNVNSGNGRGFGLFWRDRRPGFLNPTGDYPTSTTCIPRVGRSSLFFSKLHHHLDRGCAFPEVPAKRTSKPSKTAFTPLFENNIFLLVLSSLSFTLHPSYCYQVKELGRYP
jgi:hypothetical protein